MREILNYPQIDKQKIETVKNLIDRINETSPNDDYIEELNRITGKSYKAVEFIEYWGWTDLDTLAENTLTAEPPRICDLTKDEIEEIVSIVKTCFISDDNKAEYYMELLHKSLSLTDVMSYIMSGKDAAAIANDMMTAASNSVIAL